MAKIKRKFGVYVSIILVVAVIVGVVLTIVFVNLFSPKTTTELAEKVLSVSTSGYLSDENTTDDEIDEYLGDILALASRLEGVSSENKVEIDTVKIQNYQQAMSAYQTMCQFFARELVYSTYTSVYKANNTAISSDFDKATSQMNSWASYLDETLDLVSASDDALSLTWLDCEEHLDSILAYTTDAMTRLMEVYTSCVDSPILNNDFSSAIFKISQTYMGQLTAEDATTEAGARLSSVARIYYSVSSEEYIIRYQYDTTLQQKTEDLLKTGVASGYITEFLNGTL